MTEKLTDYVTDGGRLIRTEVFMDEQGFVGEFDEIDEKAIHVTYYEGETPIATGRAFPKEAQTEVYTIGRAAVRKPWRKQGLGAKVVLALEKAAQSRGAAAIELLAQTQAQGFYERLGYTAFGTVVYDEHCPHILMRKELTRGN